jgi:hypothetical protein
MASRIGDTRSSILARVQGAFVPTKIKILLHLSEVNAGVDVPAITAVCLHYPVHARGRSIREASSLLLAHLADYLERCAQEECYAPCWADTVFHVAFDYGADVGLQDVEARVSQRLQNFFTGDDVRSRFSFRDVSSIQDAAVKRLNASRLDVFESAESWHRIVSAA